jgi:hypothetical protein
MFTFQIVFFRFRKSFKGRLQLRFGNAFHYLIRFQCQLVIATENDIENAFDSETHIQTSYLKRFENGH